MNHVLLFSIALTFELTIPVQIGSLIAAVKYAILLENSRETGLRIKGVAEAQFNFVNENTCSTTSLASKKSLGF